MLQFLYNYKNSMIVNTLLLTIATMLAGDIRTVLMYIYSLLKRVLFKVPKLISNTRVSSVKISAITNISGNRCTVTDSPEYDAVMFKLKQLNINLKHVEYCHPKLEYGRSLEYNDYFVEFIDNVDKIVIDDEIYISSSCSESEVNNEHYRDPVFVYDPVYPVNEKQSKNCSRIKHTITFFSKKLSTIEIIKRLEEWIEEYNLYSHDFMKLNGLAYITTSNYYKNTYARYNICKFSSNKTFDTVFFPNKNEIIENIDKFINGKQFYKDKGIPYNLGLLLHGEPGCGKSSFIKAFANYTNRHIIQINLSEIKTCADFELIMTQTKINQYDIPVDKRIVVIEDIDAMVDYLGDRSNIADKKIDPNDPTVINMAVLESVDTLSDRILGRHKPDDKNSLNLSFILNMIDGIYEQAGRVIIITTNYPERLDKALIRPGRFDIKINFKKCVNQTIHEIVNYYYDTKIDPEIKFIDNKFTPAEIMNKCILYDNLDKIIEYFQKDVDDIKSIG